MKFRWFGRKGQNQALDILNGGEWTCATCDQKHVGLFDLVAFAPDSWDGPRHYAPNGQIDLDGDFLSEDFCVIGGEHFMVRCVLPIPIHGIAQTFGFGCWGTLSRQNFERYLVSFDSGRYEGQGPWSSWLVNQLYHYIGAEPEACWMTPRWGRQRPQLEIQDSQHPLAIDQRDGISPEKVLEIYRHYGHAVAD